MDVKKNKGEYLMNKKGFTLIEILAVIGLLAVIALLVIPNISKKKKKSKEKLFFENVIAAFESAPNTYVYNTADGNYETVFCSVDSFGDNRLNTDLGNDIDYKIKVNSDGEVVSLVATNGEYSYSLNYNYRGYSKNNLSFENVLDGGLSFSCSTEVMDVSVVATNATANPSVISTNYGEDGTSVITVGEGYTLEGAEYSCNNGISNSLVGNAFNIYNVKNGGECIISANLINFNVIAEIINGSIVGDSNRTLGYGESTTFNYTVDEGYNMNGVSPSCNFNASVSLNEGVLTVNNVKGAGKCTITPNANTYTIAYDDVNLLYGMINIADTTSSRMHYSVNNGVVTVTANYDDGYGFINGRVYLEAGQKYIFNAESSGNAAEVEAFLMLDGNYATYYRMASFNNYEFIPTETGTYYLRLDVNQKGKTHTFSNIRINRVYPSKTVTYNGTYGDLPTASKMGHTFEGWYTSATGGNKIESTTKVTTASNQTLYSHWTTNTYAFDLNMYLPNGSQPWQTCDAGRFSVSYDGGNTWTNNVCNESTSTSYYGQQIWIKDILPATGIYVTGVSNMTNDNGIYKTTITGPVTIEISTASSGGGSGGNSGGSSGGNSGSCTTTYSCTGGYTYLNGTCYKVSSSNTVTAGTYSTYSSCASVISGSTYSGYSCISNSSGGYTAIKCTGGARLENGYCVLYDSSRVTSSCS